MITIGSADRLQRLYRLQTLTIPRQRGSLIVSGNSKTLIRAPDSAPSGSRPHYSLSKATIYRYLGTKDV